MVQKRRHFESLRKDKKKWTLTSWSAIQDVLLVRPDLVLNLSSTPENQQDLLNWLEERNLSGVVPLSTHKEDKETPSVYCIVRPQLTTVRDVIARRPRRILCIDHVTNAGNVGAMLRTMAFFGWDTVIVPTHRQGLFNASTAVASAGAIASVQILQVGSLAGCLKQLRSEASYTIVGTDSEDPSTLVSPDHLKDQPASEVYDIDDPYLRFDEHLILVLGSEDSGMSESVRTTCNKLLRIPSRAPSPEKLGDIHDAETPVWHVPVVQNSLNVSVAAGILIYKLG